jgi:hypothetical protein
VFIFAVGKLVSFCIIWFVVHSSLFIGFAPFSPFFPEIPPIFAERTFVYAGYRLKKAVCDSSFVDRVSRLVVCESWVVVGGFIWFSKSPSTLKL